MELSPLQRIRKSLDKDIAEIESSITAIDERLKATSNSRQDLKAELAAADKEVLDLVEKTDEVSTPQAKRLVDKVSALRAEQALLDERERRLGEQIGTLRQQQSRLWSTQIGLGELHESGFVADLSGRQTRQAFQLVEEERMRIARDVHDGPAQSMANLVVQAEIVERLMQKDPERALAELDSFKSVVRTVLEETRRLIFDLRPMSLDDLGIIPTLRDYIEGYEKETGTETRLHILGEEKRLPSDVEEALFRIIQEALSNVRKHARAKIVDVTLAVGPNKVSAKIKDNGQGFDVAAADSQVGRRHLGLTSMRERSELQDGHLEITSHPGKGTEVHALLEYNSAPE